MRTIILSLAIPLAILGLAAPAQAWGPAGHRWATGAAIELLPAETPAFLRKPTALAAIAEYSNEPDRWRGAGKTHDTARDSGHFVDLFDDQKVMGVLAFSALPETLAEYDAALNAGGTDQYKAGYLTYSIIDGYQQMVKDFAYWRAARVGEKKAATAKDRAWFAIDRAQREQLTLRDIGVFSHYVADTTQPQHTSVHYDGWGDFPNPRNFTQQRGFHVRWENDFVRDNASRGAIVAGTPAFRHCNCPLSQRVSAYVLESFGHVVPLFELEARGAFVWPTPDKNAPVIREGAVFAEKRLSLATAEIRDLVVLAWRESANGGVGYPVINVADIESGKVVLTRQMLGGE
jgi:hypothetical protein